MKLSIVLATLVATVTLGTALRPAPAPTAPMPVMVSPVPVAHCQVPCGIYGDLMRVQMIMEDAATIAKGMAQIQELGAAEVPNFNQVVRWTMNKDQHAQAIQDNVAAYWLAQRVKAPKDAADKAKYQMQLELMHGITVAAMKCKQTTDASHVDALRQHTMKFAKAYFSEEDYKHLAEHLGG